MHTFILAPEQSFSLAHNIAQDLQLPVGKVLTTHFADSEIAVSFETDQNITNGHAVVVCATSRPVNDHLIQLLFTLKQLKNKGVSRITVVMPYFGYARQDNAPESIAHFVLRLLKQAGADKVVTVELHNPAIKDNSPLPIVNILLHDVLAESIARITQKDVTIIAPDEGALSRAQLVAQHLDAALVVCDKERFSVNKTRLVSISGSCSTFIGVVVDDIVDTGSTLINVAHGLREQHDTCHLYAFMVHPVLSADAIEALQHSPFEQIWITNSIAWPLDALPNKFHVIDIHKKIAASLAHLL